MHRDALVELLTDDALDAVRGEGSSPIGAENLREIERRVMLSMIDQHWREHLYEMDYLREGINLRAMGQKDPLAEWQREGFDMFEAMMGQIQDNFVAYVSHLQVASGRGGAAGAARQPDALQRGRGPVQGSGALRAAAAAVPPDELDRRLRPGVAGAAAVPDGARGGRPAAGAGREDPGPQRALLLRERQEVQALPRPLTQPARACSACATSPTTSPNCAAASTTPARYLQVDAARGADRGARGAR